VLCQQATPEAVDALVALSVQHGACSLAVYCARPKALSALLAERGITANTYSITDALLKGQSRCSAAPSGVNA
jgi:hypothetical protein